MFSGILVAVAGKEGEEEVERENHTHVRSLAGKWLKCHRTGVHGVRCSCCSDWVRAVSVTVEGVCMT